MRVRLFAGASPWREVEQGLLIISGRSPMFWRELLVAGPCQWVLAGTRWGGRERLEIAGGVWGWKGQREGLKGHWEWWVLGGHRRPHPWLPHSQRRRRIVPRRKVGGPRVEVGGLV